MEEMENIQSSGGLNINSSEMSEYDQVMDSLAIDAMESQKDMSGSDDAFLQAHKAAEMSRTATQNLATRMEELTNEGIIKGVI